MKSRIILLLLILYPIVTLCQTASRVRFTINSAWKFHKGDTIPTDGEPAIKWSTVNIPHTWNASDAFDDTPGYYRGIGWYTKKIIVPEAWLGKKVYIYFKGVNQDAQVWVNNRKAGTHQGGYTAFNLDITQLIKYGESNAISIKVDNSYNKNIPPLNADFNFYGGIYRDVELIVTQPVHLDMTNYASSGVFVETPSVSEQRCSVLVKGKVNNESDQNRKIDVYAVITDKNQHTIANGLQTLDLSPRSSAQFNQSNIQIAHPQLWSPGSPYLYTVNTIVKDHQTGEVIDQATNPLGVRWFSVDPDKGFFLNGKSMPLVGASRHQDFFGLGNALTPAMHRHDFEMIKAMGANFVRLAHYPQDPEVYRACDELGLIVWSEIPVVNAVTASTEFFDNCKQMQTEQIRQSYNHPSVMIYGFMNEIFISMASNSKLSAADKAKNIETTLKLARELNALTKQEAPGRLTAMAMHHHEIYDETGISSIPDIAGWNLYFGWYYNQLDDLGKFLDDQHKRYPKRCMIVSEYGADADVRNFTFTPKVWDFSTSYQEIVHTSYLKQFRERPYVTGMAAWNFADFGAEGRQDAIPFINKKGLVNFDRTPKDVYYLYQANLLHTPMVHIVSNGFATRSGTEDKIGSGICTQMVTVYTNEPEISLTLNGRLMGSKKPNFGTAVFDVPFTNGLNDLRASSKSGLADELKLNFLVIPALLNDARFAGLAVNVGTHQYFWDKIENTLWIPEQPYVKGSWGYVGGDVYQRNAGKNQGIPNRINGTINHPLFQSMREGLSDFRFDVADGDYEITLLFTEPAMPQAKLVYDLSQDAEGKPLPAERTFDVLVNGEKMIEGLNLTRDYGNLQAVTIRFTGYARGGEGIDVKFAAIKGKSLLSGIKIKPLSY